MALPNAPQPTIATVALRIFSWPDLPIGAKIVWRIYLRRMLDVVSVICIDFTVAALESGACASFSSWPYGTFRRAGQLLRAPPLSRIPRLDQDHYAGP